MPAPAIYYGLNALSNNMIMADRKRLRTPKGLYRKGTGILKKKQAAVPVIKFPKAEERVRYSKNNTSENQIGKVRRSNAGTKSRCA